MPRTPATGCIGYIELAAEAAAGGGGNDPHRSRASPITWATSSRSMPGAWVQAITSMRSPMRRRIAGFRLDIGMLDEAGLDLDFGGMRRLSQAPSTSPFFSQPRTSTLSGCFSMERRGAFGLGSREIDRVLHLPTDRHVIVSHRIPPRRAGRPMPITASPR